MTPAEIEGLIQLGLLAAQGIQRLITLCENSTTMTIEQKQQLKASIVANLKATNDKVQALTWLPDPLFKGTQG